MKYFSELLASSERLSVDLESVIQSYNYGGGFLGYVANRGNKYTFELAQSFSKEYSGGEKVSYPNPIAIPINGGWRYVYGGASPTTSFDCSGLTQWTYGKAGINLPRTAQQQYDVTQHIPLSEAQAGDLVSFILPITLALILLMLGYTLAITVCFMQATQSVMPT